jgi:chromosome segregation ATPase
MLGFGISMSSSHTPLGGAEMRTPEEDHAFALLALIADPAAAKERLDTLIAERTKAEQIHAEAERVRQEATEHRSIAERTLTEVESARQQHARDAAEHAAVFSQKSSALDEREGSVAARESEVTAREERVNGREGELEGIFATRHAELERDISARAQAVGDREAEVTEREARVRKTSEEAQLLKEEWERRSTALRAALGPGPVHHVMAAETGELGASMGEAR